MKEWLTTAELTQLPGLPTSRAKLLAKAQREGWACREREKGKGFEFHIDSLPPAARIELERKWAVAADKQEGRKRKVREEAMAAIDARQKEESLRDFMALTKTEQQRADGRLAILAMLDSYITAQKHKRTTCLMHFCSDWNRQALAADEQLYGLYPELTTRTLYRWQKTLAEQGIATLGGQYNTGQDKSLIDKQPALREFIIAMVIEKSHTTITNIHAACVARFAGSAIIVPSDRRMLAWVNRWKQDNKSDLLFATNPDAWKNKDMAAFGNDSKKAERINHWWEADSTPADVMLVDGRHSIIGVIDVFTRRPMLLVSKTSKASAICLLLRRALLEWGVPENLKTDNGSDYTSKHMVRVLQALEIEHDKCAPFSGWEKPHIERLFKTFSHGIAELLPDYIGHNVADRKIIESRKAFSERIRERNAVVAVNMTADELQRHCDRWVNHIYMHNHHKGLKQTPFEALASARTPIRHITDERALDVLLAETPGDGLRTVGKKGIVIDGIHYIHAELGPLIGERVHVRFSDQVGYLYVFNQDGFVCIAESPEFTDISMQEVAIHAREKQIKGAQERQRERKASAKKLKIKDIAEEILAHREQENSALVAMPQRKINHDTDWMKAASEAASQLPDAPSAEIVPLTMAVPSTSFTDPRENHAAWLRIEMRITQGFLVSREDREGLAIYKNSDEYQSMQDMFHSFGLKAEDF